MRGSVVLAGAILGAVSLVGAPAQGSTAPDPYSSKITTEVIVRTPAVVDTGVRIRISVRVKANSPLTPTGKVRLTLSPAPGGAGQTLVRAGGARWDRTFHYNGGTAHLTGPAFPKRGDWVLTAVFTADDPQFRDSRDTWSFSVVPASDHHHGNNQDNGAGGLLPDTGGPAMLWLLLGIGLVGGGSATVVYSRRRTAAVTA